MQSKHKQERGAYQNCYSAHELGKLGLNINKSALNQAQQTHQPGLHGRPSHSAPGPHDWLPAGARCETMAWSRLIPWPRPTPLATLKPPRPTLREQDYALGPEQWHLSAPNAGMGWAGMRLLKELATAARLRSQSETDRTAQHSTP